MIHVTSSDHTLTQCKTRSAVSSRMLKRMDRRGRHVDSSQSRCSDVTGCLKRTVRGTPATHAHHRWTRFPSFDNLSVEVVDTHACVFVGRQIAGSIELLIIALPPTAQTDAAMIPAPSSPVRLLRQAVQTRLSLAHDRNSPPASLSAVWMTTLQMSGGKVAR